MLELQVALQSICSQLEQSAPAMIPSAPLQHTWQPQPPLLLPLSSRTGHPGSHPALGSFHTFKKTAFNICTPPPQYSSIWQQQLLFVIVFFWFLSLHVFSVCISFLFIFFQLFPLLHLPLFCMTLQSCRRCCSEPHVVIVPNTEMSASLYVRM